MGRLNHDTGYHPTPEKERHRRKKTKEEANKEEIREYRWQKEDKQRSTGLLKPLENLQNIQLYAQVIL